MDYQSSIPNEKLREVNAPSPITYQQSSEQTARANQTVRSAWDLYNDKAVEFDGELLKKWEGGLSILLVFVSVPLYVNLWTRIDNATKAGLFSAILTAFIVVSLELLEEDFQETSKDIQLLILKQLVQGANANIEIPSSTPFVPPSWAVRVNFIFAASLASTLTAALASVLALQWIREYDAGLARISSPIDRALRRQFRYQGVKRWKMPEVIAFLPTMLHVSLLLFICGLVEWLFHTNVIIAIATFLGLGGWVVFYVVTHSISFVQMDSPFRTPLIRVITTLVERIKIKISLFKTMKAYNPSWRVALWYMWKESGPKLEGLTVRESAALAKDYNIGLSSIVWLLNTIELSPDSQFEYLSVLKTLISLPMCPMEDDIIAEAPLGTIFELLASFYARKKNFQDFSPEEYEQAVLIVQAFAMFGRWKPGRMIQALLEVMEKFREMNDEPLSSMLFVGVARWRHDFQPQSQDPDARDANLFREICQNREMFSETFLTRYLHEICLRFPSFAPDSDEVIVWLDSLSILLHPEKISEENVLLTRHFLHGVLFTACVLLLPAEERGADTHSLPTLEDQTARILELFGTWIAVEKMQGPIKRFYYALMDQYLAHLASAQDIFDCNDAVWLVGALGQSPVKSLETQSETATYPRFFPKLVTLITESVNPEGHLRHSFKGDAGEDPYFSARYALLIVGLCLATEPLAQDISQAWVNSRKPSAEICLGWLAWFSETIESVMTDETVGRPLVQLMSNHLPLIFKPVIDDMEALYRPTTLITLTDPSLSLLVHSLLGWTWDVAVPEADDQLWASYLWDPVLEFWCKHRVEKPKFSDIPLLCALASRPEDTYRDLALEYLENLTWDVVRVLYTFSANLFPLIARILGCCRSRLCRRHSNH
jgi:hypothetical protein